MSYSDDAILNVAKEIYLSRVEARAHAVLSRDDAEYSARIQQIASDFVSFAHDLRNKLLQESES
jgi:hypothetical protein